MADERTSLGGVRFDELGLSTVRSRGRRSKPVQPGETALRRHGGRRAKHRATVPLLRGRLAGLVTRLRQVR